MSGPRHNSVYLARKEAIQALKLEKIGRPTQLMPALKVTFNEIALNRGLLYLFVKRDIKVRYKDSSLGILWSFFKPLVQLAIYYFAIGQVLGAARSIPDFAIFVFIGISAWSLFNEIVTNSTQSIVGNAGLVKKVFLPREIFPLAVSGTALFNFLMQCIILGLAIVLFARPPMSWDLLLIPLAILNIVIFSTALGIAVSAFNVFLRDTEHLVEVALTLLFWFSPIVYSYSFVFNAVKIDWVLSLYLANPMTSSIIGLQKALWVGGFDPLQAVNQVWPDNLLLLLVTSILGSSVLFLISLRIFGKLQGNFAQRL